MALLIDGPISSIEDLHGYDTQLLDMANTEGIDVTRKLALAQEEVEIEVRLLLERMSTLGQPYGPADIRPVVVTAPLQAWHAYRALEMVYRDAFQSQLNDRYAAKRDQYREMAQWAYERVVQSGLGMTADPLRRAPVPAVSAVTGGLADGTYYVAISWTNAGGYEGASSAPAKITTSGRTFQVTPGEAPSNARGWNVYAGTSPWSLYRQNAPVLALDAVWIEPDVLVTSGKMAGSGQAVGFVQAVPRVIQRG
jgi:hypothetical protein